MSNFEGHSVPFIIGWMIQDMRAEVIDNMMHDPETDLWFVPEEIVQRHIDKIMDYILNLPTEDHMK